MEITFLGHACFLIKLTTGYSVCFDPFAPGSVPGLSVPDVVADKVICSHSHMDHYGIEEVGKPATPYKGELPEFDSIDTFHDEVRGAKRGPNTINIFKADGKTVVHMGDIGCELTEEQLAKIKGCDLLMIPVGGFFTIDSDRAFDMCCKIDPKVVIPMHFSGKGFGYDVISGRERFVELVKNKGDRKIFEGGSSVNELPEEKTLLIMDPLRIL